MRLFVGGKKASCLAMRKFYGKKLMQCCVKVAQSRREEKVSFDVAPEKEGKLHNNLQRLEAVFLLVNYKLFMLQPLKHKTCAFLKSHCKVFGKFRSRKLNK